METESLVNSFFKKDVTTWILVVTSPISGSNFRTSNGSAISQSTIDSVSSKLLKSGAQLSHPIRRKTESEERGNTTKLVIVSRSHDPSKNPYSVRELGAENATS